VLTHAWAEVDLLFPLLFAHEDAAAARRLRPDALDRLASALGDEHVRIRGTLATMTEHLGTTFPAPDDAFGASIDLRERLLRLRDHVLQELAFEERCLLPRLHCIARLARTPAGVPT
jgi:hypothetical protein